MTAVVEWDNASQTKWPVLVMASTVANEGVQPAVTRTNALTAPQSGMPPCIAELHVLVPSNLQLAPTPIKLNKLLLKFSCMVFLMTLGWLTLVYGLVHWLVI